MMTTTAILSMDHIDLLVTAATRWGVLVDDTQHALAGSANLIPLDPTSAGQLLQAANLDAASRRQTLSTMDRRTIASRPAPYSFTPVDSSDLKPVEVIKAAHAAEHLCNEARRWSTSLAASLLNSVIAAATRRVPGYRNAPYLWSRTSRRTGQPIGIGTAWRPAIAGLRWIDADECAAVWDSSSLVVVTSDAVADLPAGLSARSGVFLLYRDRVPAAAWSEEAPAELALQWPECEPWLAEQLQHPDPQYTTVLGADR